MYKKLVVSLLFVALVVAIIFVVYPEKDCGDCVSESLTERDIETELAKQDMVEVSKPAKTSGKQQGGTPERVSQDMVAEFKEQVIEKQSVHHVSGGESTVKYYSDYRNDLLTRFMQDDFEQFMEEKNLQINNVQCEDAVCDIDFYSTVPLNNDEDLRNDLILDIAIKLQSDGLLSEQNQISDADNNFENIAFRIRMDESDN